MENIRQTVGKGVEAVGMVGTVIGYTGQAVTEGRWEDATRGAKGLGQMGGAVIAKSPEMAGNFIVGAAVGRFQNAWEFGTAIRECAEGKRSGWDVAYHGLGVAADMLAIGSVLNARMANRPLAERMPPAEAARYKQYWEFKQHAPEQSIPYDLRYRYTPTGNLKQVTTYDQFGCRHAQYDFIDPRWGPHMHTFEYGSLYTRLYGMRSTHLPIQ